MRTGVHTGDMLHMELRHALLVYEDDDSAFVTVHEAAAKKGRADIGPGRPASRGALAELARKLANATALSGFVPPALLYMSARTIAWRRPAAPATVFFSGDGDRKEQIGERSGRVPQPELIFAVTTDRWFVWATAHDAPGSPIGADTWLYRAPHFNVWKSGEICTGNVKLPETLSPAVLDAYEAAFFGSNFTHPNDPQGLTRHAGGPYALWRELLDGKHKAFPRAALAPMKKTLSTAIKELEAKRGR